MKGSIAQQPVDGLSVRLGLGTTHVSTMQVRVGGDRLDTYACSASSPESSRLLLALAFVDAGRHESESRSTVVEDWASSLGLSHDRPITAELLVWMLDEIYGIETIEMEAGRTYLNGEPLQA